MTASSTATSSRSSGFLRRSVEPAGRAARGGHAHHDQKRALVEWPPTVTPGWVLPSQLAAWGYDVKTLPGVIDDTALDGSNVLIVGNAWGDFTPAEVAAIDRFVSRGGGLLAAGLGWSWQESSALPDFACPGRAAGQNITEIATYPMNRLFEPFGMQWTANPVE